MGGAQQRPGIVPSWAPWAVLLVGAVLRLLRLDDWSLWEDEETSIYFALNPDRQFARSFPLFFWLLGRLYAVTGVSVYGGRLLVALTGIATLWLAYRTARRFCGDAVALVALMALVLSVGHIFWSQSIRYYMLVLAFQMLSIHEFLNGLQQPAFRSWLLAVLWLLLGMATHLSAALLAPVYGVFWTLTLLRSGAARHRGLTVIAFSVVIMGVSALGLYLLTALSGTMSFQTSPLPVGVLVRLVAYGGVPACGLALLACFSRERRSPAFAFWVLLVAVPLVEIVVIHRLNLWYAVWNHAMVSMVGIAVLAGYGWLALERSVPRRAALTVGCLAVGASLLLVVLYFTAAHGDRPRWRDATLALQRDMVHRAGARPDIYADVPGVVAHYLAVPPGETMGHPSVHQPDRRVPQPTVGRESYYVVEKRLLALQTAAWFREQCAEIGRFPARLIVRDRTVLVYRCSPMP